MINWFSFLNGHISHDPGINEMGYPCNMHINDFHLLLVLIGGGAWLMNDLFSDRDKIEALPTHWARLAHNNIIMGHNSQYLADKTNIPLEAIAQAMSR